MTEFDLPGPLWLAGCGNMAGAMLAGWLDAGLDPLRVTVIRPSGAPVAPGVRVLRRPPLDETPALLLLGMKPQKLDEALPAFESIVGPETRLLSILAGTRIATLRDRFPEAGAIVRTMPNLPVRLREGVIGCCGEQGRDANVDALMRPLGLVEWFDDEDSIDLVTVLGGSGPAFLYRFIDALAKAGAEQGLDADAAARIALATVAGAAALAQHSEDTPAALAERVASPGGTTRAGLDRLDAGAGLFGLVAETIAAAVARSREMAAEAAARGD